MTSPDEIPPALISERYQLIRIIARGGMGQVYEAENVAIGRRVAIKILDASYARDSVLRARFEREARTATSISHPHVVEMLDMGVLAGNNREPDAPFLVMELLEGETVRERMLREGPLTLVSACYIGAQVLSALGNAHARGVVHRDLKPDNVFLVARAGDASFVKLLDFGISKVRPEHTGQLELTSTGAVMGTPRYMSPEQARGQHDLDHRVDIFAAGLLLFEMLAGHSPHRGDNYNAIVASLIENDSPPLASQRQGLPPELCAIIDRALSRDREARPGVIEMLQVLRAQLPHELCTPTLLMIPPPPLPASLSSRVTRTPANPSRPRATGPGPDAPTLALRGSSVPSASRVEPTQNVAPSPRRFGIVIAICLAAGAAAALALWLLRSQPARTATNPTTPVLSGETIHFGVVRYLPQGTMRRDSSPLADFLRAQLAQPVDSTIYEDFEQVVEALRAKKLDVAMLPPTSYVKTKERLPDLRLIASLSNGGPTYQGVIVTRVGSGLTTLESLRGKIMCWVTPSSTSGYLYPRALLRKHKLDPDLLFSRTILTGDHIAALRALRDRACDAAAVTTTAVINGSEVGISAGSLHWVATTDPIPLDAIVTRADLPRELFTKLEQAILAAKPGSAIAADLNKSFSKTDGFAPIKDEDYNEVRKLLAVERHTR